MLTQSRSKGMTRYPVTAENITINGSKHRADSPAWLGLAMQRAEPRQQSALMMAVLGSDAPLDIHLDVPFRHPGDTVDPETFYRVRPRMEAGKKWKGNLVKSVAFERWNGEWFILVGFEKQPGPPRHFGANQRG